MYVLLWDIDGTLLSTARAGIFAWQDAAEEVLGAKLDFGALDTAGRTDVKISRIIAETYGSGTSAEAAPNMQHLYEKYLPRSLHHLKGHVLPNVIEILEAATARGDILNLLLTGNSAAGAKAKLTHYGLDHFFAHGAFSDGTVDRPSTARRSPAKPPS